MRTAGLGRSMRRARDRNWFNKCVIGALQELRSIVLVSLSDGAFAIDALIPRDDDGLKKYSLRSSITSRRYTEGE